MKNKGFTLVEFAVSFVLIATISILMLELIFSIKSLYVINNIETNLIIKKTILTERIYEDYNNKFLKNINSCGQNCLQFTYITNKGITEQKSLIINENESLITYDLYSVKLDKGTQIHDVKIENFNYNLSNSAINNSILNINIPIENNLFDNNYEINLNFTYNNLITSININ